MSTPLPPWPAIQVFRPKEDAIPHAGPCCACCDDYCPQDDCTPSPPRPPALVNVGEYVTDRYAAIRADLVDTAGAYYLLSGKLDLPESMVIPDTMPPPTTARFTAGIVAPLLDLGIDIRGDIGRHEAPQHAYLAGEHIGWVMPAKTGPTLTEIRAAMGAQP